MKDILKVMEEDWDARAETNGLVYCDGVRKHRNLNDLNVFFAQGRKEVELFTKDVVTILGSIPKEKRVLEIGCGFGRHSRGFSKMFEEVYAIDISGNMITKATELNSDLKNVKFIKTNGQDLKDFQDNYFDFVYSYGVFHHIPDREITYNYFQEIHRVLKRGGLFKINISAHSTSKQGWHFASGFIPIPMFIILRLPFWLAKMPVWLVKILEFLYTKVSHILSKITGAPPFVGSLATDHVVPLINDQVKQMIQNSHLTLLDLYDEALNEKFVNTWCLGRKE